MIGLFDKIDCLAWGHVWKYNSSHRLCNVCDKLERL